MTEFPQEFSLRTERMLGEEYAAFLRSYDRPLQNSVRVNTLKLSPQSFQERLGRRLEPVAWTQNGFYMDMEKRYFSSHVCYHAGLYYIQEASAMLPAALLQAQPGERILDLCAAPGGKSTEIAARMKGEGILISNDVSRSRAKALVHNLETMGMKNAVVTSAMPEKLADLLPSYFDRILIDAPCSGEGMFHKEPAMMESWMRSGPAFYHEIQKDILRAAARMLSPGGRLVYSTCTFSPLEDEGTIAWFLEHYPDFSLLDPLSEETILPERAGKVLSRGNGQWLELCRDDDPALADASCREELAKTLRIWPHKARGEGHFAAVLVRRADPAACPDCEGLKTPVLQAGPWDQDPFSEPVPAKKRKKLRAGRRGRSQEAAAAPLAAETLQPFYDFLTREELSCRFSEERLRLRDGYVSYLPENAPDLPGIHILRNGWFLGEIRKGRFEPSGAFARGLRPEESGRCIRLDAADPMVRSYLKCETLPDLQAAEGWNLVCADEFALGWCKVSGGRVKNRYPAGWRVFF